MLLIKDDHVVETLTSNGDVSRGSWKKNSAPRLRHQGIRSSGDLRVFENLAQTLVACDPQKKEDRVSMSRQP